MGVKGNSPEEEGIRVALLRGHRVNKSEMQLYEFLPTNIKATMFVPENNRFDTDSIKIPRRMLEHRSEIAKGIKNVRLAISRHRTNKFSECDFFYHSLNYILGRFDIVNSNDISRSSYTVAHLKKRFGFRFVVSCWENIPFQPIFNNKSYFLRESILPMVDHFHAYTHRIKEVLVLEGVDEGMISVVYPGIDQEVFKLMPRNDALTREYGIPGNRFVVLYVGQMVSWKGVFTLIYAAINLRQQRDDFVFVLAGEGAQKNLMNKLISDAGLQRYFVFLESVPYEKIQYVYAMADLFVLPSVPKMTWQEQFGFVLVEAMSCGVPIVAADSGSIPEVVGSAGVLFRPGDFFELADKIRFIMDNPSLQEELRVKGLKRVKSMFDARENAKQVASLYKNLLA